MLKKIISLFALVKQEQIHSELIDEIKIVQSEVDACRQSVSATQMRIEAKLRLQEAKTELNFKTLSDHERRLVALENSTSLGDTGNYQKNNDYAII